MIARALIVAAALGAGATTHVVFDAHDCGGHEQARAACECRHDTSLVDYAASADAGCCCCVGAAPHQAVPAAEPARSDPAPAAALPAAFGAGAVWRPDAGDRDRFESARGPPARSLLAQRTSFLC